MKRVITFVDIGSVSLEELRDRYKREKDGRIKQRLHILLLSKERDTQRQIAKTVHMALGQVNFWLQRFRKEGYEGLPDKPGKGRKPKLTPEQMRGLEETISKPVRMSNGYTRGWQTKDLIQHIRKEYGVAYSPRGARKLLRRLGFVRLVPRPRSKSRNQEDVEAFKKSSGTIWGGWERTRR